MSLWKHCSNAIYTTGLVALELGHQFEEFIDSLFAGRE